MPRIVMVTHYFPAHRGGIERVAGHLATRIAAGDIDIRWFSSNTDAPPGDTEHLRSHPVIAWNVLEKWGVPWPLWMPSACKSLDRAIAQADMVFLHDIAFCGSLFAFYFARKHRKPVIIMQHNGDVAYPGRVLTGLVKTVNRTIGRHMLTQATRVIFVNPEVQRQFSAFTRFKGQVTLLPYGVETQIFHPVTTEARAQLRHELGVDENRKVVLFAGRFVPRKGLAFLKTLAQSMPGIEWWFAGWGNQEADIHPAHFGLEHMRIFEDREGASLADLYRAADMLIAPSLSESGYPLPLVAMEAMACGTPVLISAEAAHSQPQQVPLLFTCARAPGDAMAISRWQEALQNVLVADLKDRREKTVALAHDRWSWDRAAQQLQEWLRDAGSAAPSSASRPLLQSL